MVSFKNTSFVLAVDRPVSFIVNAESTMASLEVIQVAPGCHGAPVEDHSTFFVLTAMLQGRCEGGIIRQLIRDNVAGPPENFQTTPWHFDPELADRNRVEFERVNGRHGLRLIERIGLGEDGYPEYRKQQQRQRDSGIPVATGEDQDNYANNYY